MRKLLFLFLIFLLVQKVLFAQSVVYMEDDKFGLKDSNGNIVTKPEYRKLVRLGDSAWIMQDGTKYGIIKDNGKVVVKPSYTQAERVLGKFVKFKKGEKYGIFDEMGFDVLPVEYSSIDLLYGGMFVTCKNYKYGISDMNGLVVLDNIFDDIYMPDFNTLVIVYDNQKYTVKRADGEKLVVPIDILSMKNDLEVTVDSFVNTPLAATGYYSVTFTDYILKLFSSISPAYELTIDELMFSQGADTVSVLMKFGWLPKFPFVYAKKYYSVYVSPNNGPLNKIKNHLKHQTKK